MNENHRKTIATIVFWSLLICFMSVVGSSFVSFAYTPKKITLNEISVITENVSVTNKANEPLTKLRLNAPKNGLKPATGELDEISKIPYTVSSEVGSEGVYSTFYVTADGPFKIELKNISFSKGEKERENVFACLKETGVESKNLKQESVMLYESKEGASSPKKFVLLVWLSSFVGEELIGVNIDFDLVVSSV